MHVLVDWDVDVIVDVLDLWHLHSFLNLLDHGHLSLLLHRHMNDLVDVLNLRHFLRDLLHFRDFDMLCYNLRYLSDVILNHWFFPLDNLVDDFWLFHLDCLNLVLHASVNCRVVNFWNLDRFLLDHDLRDLYCLLDHLGLWNFDRNFDWILNNPFLSLDDRHMHNLLLLVGHMDVNVVINVDVVVAILA
jgi:hypothetical protein